LTMSAGCQKWQSVCEMINVGMLVVVIWLELRTSQVFWLIPLSHPSLQHRPTQAVQQYWLLDQCYCISIAQDMFILHYVLQVNQY